MKAERAAIEHTLRQVHWNRRKAAQILGVSYKTLLNKIKECGISRGDVRSSWSVSLPHRHGRPSKCSP